jgi:lipopolysaccharide export system permease protein
VVALLAIGLMTGNLAARQNAMIPLIWVNALVPGLVAAWAISGLPGLPHWRRPRPPQVTPGANPA